MSTRQTYDQEGHAHFLTFSCYKRRRHLDDDWAKGIVVSILHDQLKKHDGKCVGFVVMPDHVHAIVWFPISDQLSSFMKQWKRCSSILIKKGQEKYLVQYRRKVDRIEPIWQRKYYSFNLHSADKIEEKLEYMHNNPVNKSMVARPEDWPYGSARFYMLGQSVGLPIEFPG
jgi:putative transposase